MESKFFNQQFPVLKSINNHFYVHVYCKKLLEYDIAEKEKEFNNLSLYRKVILCSVAYLSYFLMKLIPTMFPALSDLVESKLKKIEKLHKKVEKMKEVKKYNYFTWFRHLYYVYELLRDNHIYLSDEVFNQLASTFDATSGGLD